MATTDVVYAWGRNNGETTPNTFWNVPTLITNMGALGIGAVQQIDGEAAYWLSIMNNTPYGLGDNKNHGLTQDGDGSGTGTGNRFVTAIQCCSSGGTPFSPGWGSTGTGSFLQADGGDHCNAAVDTAGSVFAWGNAANGVIGNNLPGDVTNGNNPADVVVPAQVLGVGGTGHLTLKSSYGAISAGQTHMAGLLATGRVVCWGTNQYGECGDGMLYTVGSGTGLNHSAVNPPTAQTGSPANYPFNAVPVNVVGGDQGGTLLGDVFPIVKISCGNHHTLALDSNGDVYGWGMGIFGQLGQGGIDNQSYSIPKKVNYASAVNGTINLPIIDINSGGGIVATDGQSVIMDSNGNWFGFGANTFGQLGLGTTGAPAYSSVLAPHLVQLAAAGATLYTGGNLTNGIAKCFFGTRHGGFLDATGKLLVWGSNQYGAVGIPGMTTGVSTSGNVAGNTSVPTALNDPAVNPGLPVGTISKIWMGNNTSIALMTVDVINTIQAVAGAAGSSGFFGSL